MLARCLWCVVACALLVRCLVFWCSGVLDLVHWDAGMLERCCAGVSVRWCAGVLVRVLVLWRYVSSALGLWNVGTLDVVVLALVCWCVGVLGCWCAGALVRWCVGALVCWCAGVLVRWCVGGELVRWWCAGGALVCWKGNQQVTFSLCGLTKRPQNPKDHA